MLRATHVTPFLRERAGELFVEPLADPEGRVTALLDRLCRLVRRLEGAPRATVVEALVRQERRVRDTARLRGIAKTLLDLCEFQPPAGAARAPELRTALFAERGRLWPPADSNLLAPYERAAAALELPVAEVERLLYADLPEARILARAPRLDGAALLARYNLELARAVLLGAVRVRITSAGGWRRLFTTAKLARLMYTVTRRPGRRYRIEVTGPAAEFVARRERYGSRLARLVPTLAGIRGAELDATVLRDGRELRYRLDLGALRQTRRRRRRYDSSWERALAEEFAAKLGEHRRGWSLHRESTPVAVGPDVFLPDFTLRHRDGREALVEVIGFWTPEYLEAKREKVRRAGLDNLILVIYEGLAAGGDWPDEVGAVVRFVNKPRIAPVLEAAERVARRPAGEG